VEAQNVAAGSRIDYHIESATLKSSKSVHLKDQP
jgi:hypothetical protein